MAKYDRDGSAIHIEIEPGDFPAGTATDAVTFSLPAARSPLHHPDCAFGRPLPPADDTEKLCEACTCMELFTL